MKKIIVFLIVLLVFAFSCQIDSKIDSLNTSVPNNLSEQYYSSIAKMNEKFKNEKKTVDGTEFYNYFEILDVNPANNTGTSFNNLSEPEQEDFEAVWIEENSKALEEKIQNNPYMQEYIKMTTNCLTKATDDAEIFPEFQELYKAYYMEAMPEFNKITEGMNGTNVFPTRSTATNLAKLKTYYKWGRVFTTIGTSSSSEGSGSGLGHGAISYKDVKWNSAWSNTTPITVSSWGNGATGHNGVQTEKLELWLNKQTGVTINAMSYLKIGNVSWWTWTEATSTDHVNAKNYAVAQIGKPYNFNIFNKWPTDTFYCSSIVWRAWYQANNKYDLDSNWWDTWVSAADIYNAEDTKLIFEGANDPK